MHVLITGSGISGMSAAISLAEAGCRVTLVSPFISERAQSVMAAGGINAVLDETPGSDSTALHAEETLKGGCYIENKEAVRGLCEAAPDIVRWLDSIGVIFSRTQDGEIAQRPFGGQSRRRTAYAGDTTGKQIVTAMAQKCREYEIKGLIDRRTGLDFHSAIVKDGRCGGAVYTDRTGGELQSIYADALIMATGGMNRIFGKTTGSALCDGYAAGRLLSQGARLRNAEMIQYHPTTIETPNKRMLISEAARGEGGRLYYEKDGGRVYFMEDRFGEKGNLMPRDVVSRCMYECPSQVYLDISFLGERLIKERLGEIYKLCLEYLGLDVTKESIPVAPGVHFFMGGLRTDDDHMTDIDGLYAVGEGASKYHGANRLGGNSLLAALYSGRVAAGACMRRGEAPEKSFGDVSADILSDIMTGGDGPGPSQILTGLAGIMNTRLGIVRDEEGLRAGLAELDALSKEAERRRYDEGLSAYENYRIPYMLITARAIIMSALAREESRGAHFRSDFPDTRDEYCRCSLTSCSGGELSISFEDDRIRGDRQ